MVRSCKLAVKRMNSIRGSYRCWQAATDAIRQSTYHDRHDGHDGGGDEVVQQRGIIDDILVRHLCKSMPAHSPGLLGSQEHVGLTQWNLG